MLQTTFIPLINIVFILVDMILLESSYSVKAQQWINLCNNCDFMIYLETNNTLYNLATHIFIREIHISSFIFQLWFHVKVWFSVWYINAAFWNRTTVENTKGITFENSLKCLIHFTVFLKFWFDITKSASSTLVLFKQTFF